MEALLAQIKSRRPSFVGEDENRESQDVKELAAGQRSAWRVRRMSSIRKMARRASGAKDSDVSVEAVRERLRRSSVSSLSSVTSQPREKNSPNMKTKHPDNDTEDSDDDMEESKDSASSEDGSQTNLQGARRLSYVREARKSVSRWFKDLPPPPPPLEETEEEESPRKSSLLDAALPFSDAEEEDALSEGLPPRSKKAIERDSSLTTDKVKREPITPSNTAFDFRNQLLQVRPRVGSVNSQTVKTEAPKEFETKFQGVDRSKAHEQKLLSQATFVRKDSVSRLKESNLSQNSDKKTDLKGERGRSLSEEMPNAPTVQANTLPKGSNTGSKTSHAPRRLNTPKQPPPPRESQSPSNTMLTKAGSIASTAAQRDAETLEKGKKYSDSFVSTQPSQRVLPPQVKPQLQPCNNPLPEHQQTCGVASATIDVLPIVKELEKLRGAVQHQKASSGELREALEHAHQQLGQTREQLRISSTQLKSQSETLADTKSSLQRAQADLENERTRRLAAEQELVSIRQKVEELQLSQSALEHCSQTSENTQANSNAIGDDEVGKLPEQANLQAQAQAQVQIQIPVDTLSDAARAERESLLLQLAELHRELRQVKRDNKTIIKRVTSLAGGRQAVLDMLQASKTRLPKRRDSQHNSLSSRPRTQSSPTYTARGPLSASVPSSRSRAYSAAAGSGAKPRWDTPSSSIPMAHVSTVLPWQRHLAHDEPTQEAPRPRTAETLRGEWRAERLQAALFTKRMAALHQHSRDT